MNQILVTEKIIVTPDLKKKRKIYKFNFFLSSFLACLLISCCIYAEYDRNKSEQVSQGILLGLQDEVQEQDNTTISMEDDILIINALAEGEEDEVSISNETLNNKKASIVESIAPDGKSYYTEAIVKIDSLGIEYPVLSDTSDELLKISVNKLWGPEPNEVRKLCNSRTQL